MARKKLTFEEVTQLYIDTKHKITQPEAWLRFLDTACRNFRLPFDEQVLVYAQEPNATAVLPTYVWNRRFSRWVNRGTNGIAVLDFSGESITRLKYYFDISDTHAGRYARLVPLWELLPEFRVPAISALESRFGPLPDTSSLAAAILESAKVLMAENFERYWELFLEVKDDSALAEVPENVMRNNYRDMLELSVAYCVMRRCGLDAGHYISSKDFTGIEQFDTLETANSLGVPTAFMSQEALNAIAYEILPRYRRWQLEQQKAESRQNSERSMENNGYERDRSGTRGDKGEDRPREGDSLRPGERVLAPGSDIPRTEERIPHGYVGPGTYEVDGGEPASAPGESDDLGDAAGLPERYPGAGGEHDELSGGTVGGTGGRDGGTEAPRPDGMGTPDEQHSGPGAGSGVSRADPPLILPLIPSPEEQQDIIEEAEAEAKPASAFFVSQEDIDAALRNGSGYQYGKFRIYRQFLKKESDRENAEFLKKEYGVGGGTFVFPDGTEGWIHYGTKGLQLEKQGSYVEPDLRITWGKAAKNISRLCTEGRYLNPGELEQYQQWLEAEGPEEAKSQAPALDAGHLRCHVGDVAYIQGDTYKITRMEKDHVWLQDIQYPLFTADYDRAAFEALLRQDGGNQHLFVLDKRGEAAPEQDSADSVKTDGVGALDVEDSAGEAGVPETQAVPWEAPRRDYRITADDLGAGTPSERYQHNVAAIRCLKRIEAENRPATPVEQDILAQYVGWGGLAGCFDERHSKYRELKSLLTEDEYTAARESTLTAFFTPPAVIRAIYQGLENLGFRRGNILEPSCGTGNFLGLLPESLGQSRFYGVELDSLSGRIARQLYPTARIAVQGYESAALPDSFFDVAVGNVPFGDFKVLDRKYDKHHWLIHDYFFGKTLDKVRPGGVIAFITSKGTLDKKNPAVRRYIAQRAKLLGAIRLPNTTFMAAAGTEVTSDIIFLQKRDSVVEADPEWVHLGLDENGIAMNAYFVSHPEMILGEMQLISGPHGPESVCILREGDRLAELLAQAATRIQGEVPELDPQAEFDLMEEPETELSMDPDLPNYSYCMVNGEIYYKVNGTLSPAELKPGAVPRVKALTELRDCARTLIRLETEDYPEEDISSCQKRLNALYDTFSVKYGRIVDQANARAMSKDASYPLLAALEEVDSKGNFLGKSAFFSKRTIKPKRKIDRVDTAAEALEVSMAERARVDMPLMCRLTGKSEADVYEALQGVIFLNPEWEEGGTLEKYLTADEYLSGNVRQKLKLAKLRAEHSPAVFCGHVAALEAVQPVDLTAAEISVRLGATWVPAEIIDQFGKELFEVPFWQERNITVQYSAYTAQWRISGKHAQGKNVLIDDVYGTKRINGWEILEQSLNLREVSVYDYIESAEGKKRAVLNQKETLLARGKQEQIRRKFEEWIWADPERRSRLCSLYNEQFNSFRPREYDGSFLELAGINPEITLRPHQLNAIARIILGGNTLIGHVMSAGKTFTMTAAAMETKRLGLCHKSLFVVPNNLTGQWGAEFMRLYPAANILVASEQDFERQNRKAFCARIAAGDYDAVIIGHSQFERIPLSVIKRRDLLERQLEEILNMLSETKGSRGERFTIKELERSRKAVQAKLAKLNNQDRKDDLVTFEELGVDRLFVDEAHFYKNLAVFSKMRNVAGISQSEAMKSSDLFLKCRYMDELTGNRGNVFGTGTPISNSMVELYIMQLYLQYSTLARNGFLNFDAWASTFGETVTAIELSPTGTGYRSKTRFARFYNLPELMMMFREVADIQTAESLHLPLPEAVRETVVLPPSEIQKKLVAKLGERAERIQSGMVSPSEDNMLLITNDGRKLALDQRLIDPLLPPSPTRKSAACAQRVYQTWLDTAETRGTQLIFCDLSTPNTKKKFEMQPNPEGVYELIPEQFTTVYDDVKDQLIRLGIPEAEIAFIHEATTKRKRDALFAKVREGEVRILMGSTSKLGTGTNVQTRVTAIHHLDCPWRPIDLQQQDARGIRVGNMNSEVTIFTYVTEGTFDAYLYQMVERKQGFIGQITTSKSPVRAAEDIDAQALVYAEIKALSAGDERIKEKMDLEVDVARLRLYKMDYLSQRYALEDTIYKELPKTIQAHEKEVADYQADISLAQRSVKNDAGFYGPMVIGGHSYQDKQSAGKALLAILIQTISEEPVVIGSYRGFEMKARGGLFEDHEVLLCGALRHYVTMSTDEKGNIQRLDNALARLTERLQAAERSLEYYRRQLETSRAEVKKPFPQEEELAQKEARLAELNAELDLDRPSPEVLVEEDPELPETVRARTGVAR